VECYTGIHRSRRPITVEDDHAGDESSYSIPPLGTPGGYALSDSVKAKPLQTVWRLGFRR